LSRQGREAYMRKALAVIGLVGCGLLIGYFLWAGTSSTRPADSGGFVGAQIRLERLLRARLPYDPVHTEPFLDTLVAQRLSRLVVPWYQWDKDASVEVWPWRFHVVRLSEGAEAEQYVTTGGFVVGKDAFNLAVKSERID